MKIGCHCDATIYDVTDELPYKAHIIPDQVWNEIYDAIDAAIEKSGPSPKEKEEACMKIRSLIGRFSRLAWQCSVCGRIYVDDQQHQLREFVPGSDDVPREIFRVRPFQG